MIKSIKIISFFLLLGIVRQGICNDKVHMFNDRTLYLSGEYVFLSAVVDFDKNLDSTYQSKVLYVELITQRGESLAKGKFPIKNNKSYGEFQIPHDTSAGLYFLRAYTNWQRNFSPTNYAYSLIKVVEEDKPIVYTDTLYSVGSKKIPVYQSISNAKCILLDHDTFGLRQKVNVECNLEFLKNELSHFSLSVVRKGAFEPYACAVDSGKLISQQTYYPDYRGLSVSGHIADSANTTNVENVMVNLTVLGSAREHYSTYSNAEGDFYFSLPNRIGKQEIFLSSTAYNRNLRTAIWVNNDFCNQKVILPTYEFSISDAEVTLLNDMGINLKIGKAFDHEKVASKPQQKPKMPFYGVPDKFLLTADYIRLPLLEDYFKEFFKSVSVKNNPNGKRIIIYKTNDVPNVFDPLVLLDGVALGDYSSLWQINTYKIKSIELVNNPFVRGSTTYGGIIQIKTYQNDFGNVDLPSSGLFFDYTFYSEFSDFVHQQPQNKHMPDVRNVLSWLPCTETEKGPTSVSFFIGDVPGNYQIVIQGITFSGQRMTYTRDFNVIMP